jgi:hypothetical protein
MSDTPHEETPMNTRRIESYQTWPEVRARLAALRLAGYRCIAVDMETEIRVTITKGKHADFSRLPGAEPPEEPCTRACCPLHVHANELAEVIALTELFLSTIPEQTDAREYLTKRTRFLLGLIGRLPLPRLDGRA